MEEGYALLQLHPERLYDSGEKLERGQSPLSNIGRSLATLKCLGCGLRLLGSINFIFSDFGL